MAIYECRDCFDVTFSPRRFRFHLGKRCRCPICGTFRITRLKERDKIDRMNTGFLHFLERMAGGRLFHCKFCRLQFYDRRKTAVEIAGPERPSEPDLAAKA